MDRRNGIGGTDIGAILGINPYKTAYDVYQEKVHNYEKDLSWNEKVIWGNLLEEPISRRYADLMKVDLISIEPIQSLKHPYLFGSPDRLIKGRKKGLEIKAVGESQKCLWGASGSQEVPEYYYIQAAHYMLVLDYDSWDIAVLIGGQELRIYSFERDREIDNIILTNSSVFWRDHILKRVPPPINFTHPSTKETIKNRFKFVNEEIKDLNLEDLALVNDFEKIKSNIKELETLKNEIESKLLFTLEDCGIGKLPDGRSIVRQKIVRKPYTVKECEYIKLEIRNNLI
jgi:putative phage-type endonuclease